MRAVACSPSAPNALYKFNALIPARLCRHRQSQRPALSVWSPTLAWSMTLVHWVWSKVTPKRPSSMRRQLSARAVRAPTKSGDRFLPTIRESCLSVRRFVTVSLTQITSIPTGARSWIGRLQRQSARKIAASSCGRKETRLCPSASPHHAPATHLPASSAIIPNLGTMGLAEVSFCMAMCLKTKSCNTRRAVVDRRTRRVLQRKAAP